MKELVRIFIAKMGVNVAAHVLLVLILRDRHRCKDHGTFTSKSAATGFVCSPKAQDTWLP